MSDQHPSKSGSEQVLQSEQENLLPDTDSVPSLPERSPLPSGERPKPGFTPSTRNPNLDTPLPPPPPEPGLNKEADPKTSVESQPAQRTSRNMSQQGDTGAKPENGRASGADFGKRKSGNGDVQVEMDELDDPTLVDIVQVKTCKEHGHCRDHHKKLLVYCFDYSPFAMSLLHLKDRIKQDEKLIMLKIIITTYELELQHFRKFKVLWKRNVVLFLFTFLFSEQTNCYRNDGYLAAYSAHLLSGL